MGGGGMMGGGNLGAVFEEAEVSTGREGAVWGR